MDYDCVEQGVTSGFLSSINFGIVTDEDVVSNYLYNMLDFFYYFENVSPGNWQVTYMLKITYTSTV